MNGFTKKIVGTLTLGEKLKKLRSDKRLSLNEISRNTRISVKYLERLEDGEYDKLPADVYVRGFLKSYADFLGMDAAALLRLYSKEKEIKKNVRKKNSGEEKLIKPLNVSAFVFTPRKVLMGVIVLAVVSAFVYLYSEIGSFVNAPRLIIISPEKNASLSGSSLTVEGLTDRDARIFINDHPILVNDEGRFRENIAVQSGENIISVKAVNKFDKETVETLAVKSRENDAPDEAEKKPSGENDKRLDEEKLTLEIRVDPGPVWLSVEADGNLVFSGTMLTGAVQSFKAREKIAVDSGRGDATFINFNGKDVGPLSRDSGAVRKVVFDSNTKY